VDYQKYLQLRKHNKWSNTEFIENEIGIVVDAKFKEFYLENIEAADYLKLDTLIIDTGVLEKLSNYKKIIISLRTNEENSKRQLEFLGLDTYFEESYFVQHSKKINPKTAIIQQIKKNNNVLCFFGDTENDEIAAIENDIQFQYVSTSIYPNQVKDLDINQALKKLFHEI
jgi:phosphoglycolate phosphatase-like HAD superfamily hydrolase